jgi:23S rRNA (cytidine1920-2'-O)/16S rRNA (cytidine1409-2'-O)-methyltransferase
MAGKERLDVLIVGRGLAESREMAKRLCMAGQVLVDGHPVTKSGHRIAEDAAIELKATSRWVSRGGEKMEGAMAAFGVDPAGCSCLDIGASTGGFTDCLLQHGALCVCCVDVGKGQLHWKLRQDPRVTVMEGVNARYLEPEQLPFVPDFAVFDVSFISLRLVMPPVVAMLAEGGEMITLIKPQFEAGREHVGKGGVVRDPEVRQACVDRIREFGQNELKLEWLGQATSPIKGPAGNVEFLGWWRKPSQGAGKETL